jgi:hypothetical protein
MACLMILRSHFSLWAKFCTRRCIELPNRRQWAANIGDGKMSKYLSKEQRSRIAKNSLANQRLAGLEPPVEAAQLGEEWVDGKISIKTAISRFDEFVKARSAKSSGKE